VGLWSLKTSRVSVGPIAAGSFEAPLDSPFSFAGSFLTNHGPRTRMPRSAVAAAALCSSPFISLLFSLLSFSLRRAGIAPTCRDASGRLSTRRISWRGRASPTRRRRLALWLGLLGQRPSVTAPRSSQMDTPVNRWCGRIGLTRYLLCGFAGISSAHLSDPHSVFAPRRTPAHYSVVKFLYSPFTSFRASIAH